MSVPVAYATMLVVWSTTPLAIAWSSEAVTPVAAIAMRMIFAAALGFILLRFFGLRLSWSKAAVRAYAASMMGVFGALSCAYLASHYIPSGLISVVFAMSPVLSNLFARKVLGQGEFTFIRWVAFALAFAGLAIICLDGWVIDGDGWKGIGLMLVAVSLYSLSGVLLQRESFQTHPLCMSVGTLLLSAPLFVLSWWFFDGSIPVLSLDTRSIWAVLYLAVFGSLLGFVAYFHVLHSMGAIAVAMVTLVTPVTALLLGSLLNHEPITAQMSIGTIAILAGLVLYYQGDALFSVTQRQRT